MLLKDSGHEGAIDRANGENSIAKSVRLVSLNWSQVSDNSAENEPSPKGEGSLSGGGEAASGGEAPSRGPGEP